MQSWLGIDQRGMRAQRFTRTCASFIAVEDEGRRRGRMASKKKEIKKKEGREGRKKEEKIEKERREGEREGGRGKEGGAGFTTSTEKLP